MKRLRIQLLLSDNTGCTRCKIAKKDRYKDLSKEWTLVKLDLTEKNCGIKSIYE